MDQRLGKRALFPHANAASAKITHLRNYKITKCVTFPCDKAHRCIPLHHR
jgi:hypothetical protein